MKDVGTALQTAYVSALAGITVNGQAVGVYDAVPAVVNFPYIKIGNRTGADDPDKSIFGSDNTQAVTIVDRFPANTGTRARIYAIANEVKSRIRVRGGLPLDEFQMITATLDNEITIEELTDTYQYYRQEIRFRHIIKELVLNTFDDTFDDTFA